MAFELALQQLKATAKKSLAWIKRNPTTAALIGSLAFVLVLFVLIIVTILSGQRKQAREAIAADDASYCQRLQKLDRFATAHASASHDVQQALEKLFELLTRSEPTPDDLATMALHARDCTGLDNDDVAWLVALDARVSKGVWPTYPEKPPTVQGLRKKLVDLLDKHQTLQPKIGAPVRDAWLLFAAEWEMPPKALMAELLPEHAPAAEVVAAYNKVLAKAAEAPILPLLFDRLQLLTRPIYVVDRSPPSKQAPLPLSVHGPQGTLPFLGVLDGDQCAIATTRQRYPAISIRSCDGLVPRRLGDGEVFLLGGEAKLKKETQLVWLPLLVDNRNQPVFGDSMGAEPNDKLLSTFVLTAPRFFAKGRTLTPFAPPLTIGQAPLGNRRLIFKSAPMKERAAVLAFARDSALRVVSDCPHLEKTRCDSLRTQAEGERCELGATTCAVFPGGSELRWALAHLIKPEQCLKEFGVDARCDQTDTFTLFVDVKAPGTASFVDGAGVTVLMYAPEAK